MYKKILLPIDLADRHTAALQAATHLAEPSGGELVLLHVIEVIAGLSLNDDKNFYDRLATAAWSQIHRLGSLLEGKVKWQGQVRFGHRAPEIVRSANEWNADLIVLTAPRPDPANPIAGWGSMSYKASILSRCPVLLVK